MVELSTRDKVSAEKVAEKYHVDRTTLYFWKSKMTTGKEIKLPDKCNTGNLEKDNEQLKLENERLRQEKLLICQRALTAIKKVEKKLISTAKCEKRFK